MGALDLAGENGFAPHILEDEEIRIRDDTNCPIESAESDVGLRGQGLELSVDVKVFRRERFWEEGPVAFGLADVLPSPCFFRLLSKAFLPEP